MSCRLEAPSTGWCAASPSLVGQPESGVGPCRLLAPSGWAVRLAPGVDGSWIILLPWDRMWVPCRVEVSLLLLAVARIVRHLPKKLKLLYNCSIPSLPGLRVLGIMYAIVWFDDAASKYLAFNIFSGSWLYWIVGWIWNRQLSCTSDCTSSRTCKMSRLANVPCTNWMRHNICFL